MPKVSVLLTSYNQRDYLDKAIRSVMRQTYADFELIILDDNSTDERVRKVMWWWKMVHPNVQIYISNIESTERMKTCRYASLINIGLHMARGEYITYLTDDDEYYPERLEKMVSLLDSDNNINIVYGNQMLADGEGGIFGTRECNRVLDDAYDIVDHNSVMHRKFLAFQAGGWDDNPLYWRGADGIFWRRLTNLGHKFYPVNAFTELHRFHTQSVRHKLLELGLDDLN